MNILVKFPSRERPHKFFLAIKHYIDLSHGENVRYLITLDSNDPTLNLYVSYCEKLKEQGVNIEWIIGESTGKIHAVNRDMDKSGEWDIVVLASDDMICKIENWDIILQNEMSDFYPDTDGILYHNDGFTTLNTMCIIGRKYFDRFGYLYHPDYISLFCDNEFMEVSRKLGKETYFDQVLFRHEHWSNGKQFSHTNDDLMKRTEKWYEADKATYELRKFKNFGL